MSKEQDYVSKIPFTVYDFFAYLFPGSVIVACVDYTFGYQWLLQEKIGAVLALFLVLLAYTCGHGVAHFSTFFLEQLLVGKVLKKPSKALMGESSNRFLQHFFLGYYKALPPETQDRIRTQAKARGFIGSGEALFLHAYAIVTRDDHAQLRLDEYRNLYGFCRNMAFAFIAAAIVLEIGYWYRSSLPRHWWASIAIILGTVMLYRYLKFFRQYSFQLLVTYAELPMPDAKD